MQHCSLLTTVSRCAIFVYHKFDHRDHQLYDRACRNDRHAGGVLNMGVLLEASDDVDYRWCLDDFTTEPYSVRLKICFRLSFRVCVGLDVRLDGLDVGLESD